MRGVSGAGAAEGRCVGLLPVWGPSGHPQSPAGPAQPPPGQAPGRGWHRHARSNTAFHITSYKGASLYDARGRY